jgi:hypothetical protein
VCRLNWNVGVVTFFGADVVKLAGLQQTEMFSRTACLLAAFSVDPKAKCLLVLDNGYDSLLAHFIRKAQDSMWVSHLTLHLLVSCF